MHSYFNRRLYYLLYILVTGLEVCPPHLYTTNCALRLRHRSRAGELPPSSSQPCPLRSNVLNADQPNVEKLSHKTPIVCRSLQNTSKYQGFTQVLHRPSKWNIEHGVYIKASWNPQSVENCWSGPHGRHN